MTIHLLERFSLVCMLVLVLCFVFHLSRNSCSSQIGSLPKTICLTYDYLNFNQIDIVSSLILLQISQSETQFWSKDDTSELRMRLAP